MNEDQNNKYTISRFNLLTSLLAILNTNDENDTNFIIAKYFLTHLDDISKTSIYELADNCFVSRSSVQRFIKSIGYDSYGQVKENLKEVIIHESAFLDYTDHSNYSNYIAEEINNMVTDIIKSSNSETFIKLNKLFLKTKNVVILTAEDSSSACRLFQQQVLSTGKLIRLISSANPNQSLLQSLNKEDLLMVCSVTGNFAIAINSQINEIKAKKCLITINKTAVFEDNYDFIYYIGNNLHISSRNIVQSKNVYTNYGLSFFFDLFFHEYSKNTINKK